MQFSIIKKRVEQLLAPSLQGRIAFRATVYRIQDNPSRVWMTFDGEEILGADDFRFEREVDRRYALRAAQLPEKPDGALWQSDWLEQSHALSAEIERQVKQDGYLENYEMQQDLLEYPNLAFEQALVHPHPFIRGIARLDRRLGKRRFLSLTHQSDFEQWCADTRQTVERW
ncbi:SF0329 family protein [Exiguobacterium sp. R-17]|uniref:SF0329 family protein n=1 Tax=Exiguobacterium sp. R-17 TaxID=3404054 RepID=UPI003CF2F5A7